MLLTPPCPVPPELYFHLWFKNKKTTTTKLQDCKRKACYIVSVCFMLMFLSMYFVLALKKPLISAPKSEGHQPVINLPTEQPHAPNLAPGKILICR